MPLGGVPMRAGKLKRGRWTPWLAGRAFVIAFAWASGPIERAASLGVRLFELYAQSRLVMLEAVGHVTDGRAEYAVLLDKATSIARLMAVLTPMASMRHERESALPGRVVVSTADGDRDALVALKSAPFARLVVPNRELRICH